MRSASTRRSQRSGPEAKSPLVWLPRCSTDVAVSTGVRHAPIFIAPGFLRLVLVVDEDGLGTLVVLLTRQIAGLFQQQNFPPRRRQLVRQRASAGAGANTDHIVVSGHGR